LRDFFVRCGDNASYSHCVYRSPVPNQHSQKVDLAQEYPCPCHIKGKLQQIVLTEAFGCDRCHRIFVLQTDGCTIEELATNYPYRRQYIWNGKSWKIFRTKSPGSFVSSWDSWVLWLQGLGLMAILLGIFRWYYRSIAATSFPNLVSSMAIATFVLIVITLWLFSQG
jgi:hypothetical protein